ncbi:conserved hypothetical protein [Bradyrhizobium sp. ORS 285]|uniref:hypothetical protein n=1 Tax=Bradyrhizobium sp. ORS 285 TaxID=115808 RepID=UPI000240952B|nr:hypothetical protein [Bradyrhizobium sp. ORS 285]CCD88113.1 conserved hypothetical protein [Bradyrhizobium sp. ORS 285]SMX58901.1 conserved hypothetical protein [Bradyrhizobium sp. ORS 285]
MQILQRGSTEFTARHQLDALPLTEMIAAHPVTPDLLGELAALARREIPGVRASERELAEFLRHDPESIFALCRGKRLLGGIAFLYLNCAGLDALLLDEFNLNEPPRQYLARPDEDAAAIYVWALVARGRGAVGLGNVAHAMRAPRYRAADYYAQPSSAEGRAFLGALGFAPLASFQPDLWWYQRPWNRLPEVLAPSLQSTTQFVKGSLADARH